MHNVFLDTISGKNRGLPAGVARGALALCEPAYACGVRYRNWRFDQPRGSIAVEAPVISVGNLTTGGTGKTPVVAWIVNRLIERGRRPAILSRGYKSLDGAANDEGLLLDRLCPGVPHVQNPDRVAGARRAIDEHGCDVLVLDDGFQHRRLRRDADVVLIDALNPWGYGHLLPRGLLREPPSALQRASLVMITRGDLCDAAALGRLRAEIADDTTASVVTSAFHPSSLVDVSGTTSPLTALSGRNVLAFSGIGNPDGFRRTLAAIDPEMFHVKQLVFPDHHHYRSADLLRIAAAAKDANANLLLTTEKDLVKLPEEIEGVPVRAVRIGLEFLSGADPIEEQLNRAAADRTAA